MKCGFSGCKNEATYQVKQKIGKKNTLNMCSFCDPAWVKRGIDNKFYAIKKLT